MTFEAGPGYLVGLDVAASQLDFSPPASNNNAAAGATTSHKTAAIAIDVDDVLAARMAA